MGFRNAGWGSLPGLQGVSETYESAFRWGVFSQGVITSGYIASTALDPTNSPTWELRPGLVLGIITATGAFTNYSKTATDGSDVACAILMTSLRIQDLQGVAQPRFYGVLVGGPVQAAKLIGLDGHARQNMDKFQFDDNPLGYVGSHWYPWRRFQTKTANYTLVANDNFSQFDNAGAAGEVDFTLPPVSVNGYAVGFRAVAAQTLKVISAEGANLVAFNSAAASSVAFSTAGSIVGGAFTIFNNPAGILWYVAGDSAGNNSVTVA